MLKLSTLRFKAFRILLMTAKGDPNQVLTAFNLLGLAIVFPYLWLYLSEVAIGFVKLFLGIVLLIFIARQWLHLPWRVAAVALAFITFFHAFITAVHDGGIWGVGAIWMVALGTPILWVFGVRTVYLVAGIGFVGGIALYAVGNVGLIDWAPIHTTPVAVAGIKLFLLAIFLFGLPTTALMIQKWLLVFQAKRIKKIENTQRSILKARQAHANFVSAVSHELRTPLNAVMGFIQTPPTGLSLTSRNRELLSDLGHSSKHLVTVIDDLLDLSRLQVGSFVLTAQPNDLEEWTQKFPKIFGKTSRQKNVSFLVKYDERIPLRLLFDSDRLTQVIINLLSNASKFTSKGQIVLQIDLMDINQDSGIASIGFLVTDTGIGLTEEQITAVFERASKTSLSTREGYGGNGIGLSVSQAIVRVMGGNISVTSRLGEGCAFGFQLDMPISNLPAVSPTLIRTDVAVRLKGLRVLIVDDVKINRTVLTRLLQSRVVDAVVFEAENGCEAIELAKAHDIDIILMDLLMPVMGGLEATRRLRASGDYMGPVLAVTADTSDQTASACEAAGIQGVVTKPFVHAAILEKMVSVLTPTVPTVSTGAALRVAPLDAAKWSTPNLRQGAQATQATGGAAKRKGSEGDEDGDWFAQNKPAWLWALVNSGVRNVIDLVILAGAVFSFLYAVFAPAPLLQWMYLGLGVIQCLLLMGGRIFKWRDIAVIYTFAVSCHLATTVLVLWSGGIGSSATCFFFAVPLLMVVLEIPCMKIFVPLILVTIFGIGWVQGSGYLMIPSVEVMEANAFWPLLLYFGLAGSFSLVPVLRVAVYGRFLSDLRAKRKKLIDSIQVLSTANYHQREFVASVSHELRAPVHAMSMALEDVDTAGIDPIKNEAGLGEVQVSIWQLLRSVDNLLDYAALFAGRLGLNVVQVALPGFFDNLVAVLASPDFVREESQITRRVTLSADPDLPSWVRLDPRRLTQVLTELCRNAYASSRNSAIAIDVGSVVDAAAGVVHVSIAVTDSGGGISEKDQQNIFDPFLPLSGSVSRDTGGVGLGLPIAYSLVRLMNGNVLLKSEMGVGSTFTVTLQLPIVDAPKPPSAAATLPVQRTQHGQVLVVDDSEQTLLIVGRLINKNFPNVTVLVASDAEDAIRMFALQPIQVVLMDMLMPTVDGLTATRRMRSEVESSRAEKACIIGFTADGSDEARMACLSAGMDDLILKPFHHQALLDRIGKALSDRQ